MWIRFKVRCKFLWYLVRHPLAVFKVMMFLDEDDMPELPEFLDRVKFELLNWPNY